MEKERDKIFCLSLRYDIFNSLLIEAGRIPCLAILSEIIYGKEKKNKETISCPIPAKD